MKDKLFDIGRYYNEVIKIMREDHSDESIAIIDL